MDGTLLNDKKKISFYTKHYLRKLSKKHIVVLSSGRPIRSLLPYYNDLRLKTPMVCYNGALVYNPKDKKFPEIISMFTKEDMIRVFKDLYPKYVANVICESSHGMYFIKPTDEMNRYFWYKGMDIHIGELDKTLDENLWTFLFIKKDDGNHDVDIVREVNKNSHLEARFWGGLPYGEIYHRDVSKARGVIEIAKYYHIPKERMIAFGDAGNDFEMLDSVGIGVTMKNGPEEAIKFAKILSVDDNNHNGIPKTLKKILKSHRN